MHRIFKVPWFLIADFSFSQATHIPDENFFSFWKIWLLHRKSNKIALFVEQAPCYCILKVENILNLVCWFSFDTSYPNSIFKIPFILEFLSVEHPVFSMCKVSWFLIVNFTLSLVTQTPCVKRFVLKVVSVLQKKQRYWQGTLKITWILLVGFDLSLLTGIR